MTGIASTWRRASAALAIAVLAGPVAAEAPACNPEARLAAGYCDRDGDLLADLPSNPLQWRNPATLVWAYSPIEDPAIYAELFRPLTTHLAACLGRQVVYYPVQSNRSQIEALRTGRVHLVGLSTGATVVATREAGAVPFAAKGTTDGVRGYHLAAIVRADSDFHHLSDLAGHRVAHSTVLSNSGHLAPRALFPADGLTPGRDYVPIMSGSHDNSILGVLDGSFHMAAVASDVLERMIERGLVPGDGFRVIYLSGLFPTSSFAHAHDLDPALAEALRACFFSFSFPERMQAEFNGDDRFLPLSYRDDWTLVREVMDGAPDQTFRTPDTTTPWMGME